MREIIDDRSQVCIPRLAIGSQHTTLLEAQKHSGGPGPSVHCCKASPVRPRLPIARGGKMQQALQMLQGALLSLPETANVLHQLGDLVFIQTTPESRHVTAALLDDVGQLCIRLLLHL